MDIAIEEAWEPARLIPTTGIGGTDEQERRAVSALLAVARAVDEFGRSFTGVAGAPSGKIETFIEPHFELGDRTVIPDGLIRITRGKKTWVALVEVKTGDNSLERGQLEDYLEVAKMNGFDALLTISNQIAPIAGMHPTEVDKRKLRKVQMTHVSWTRILTIAVVEQTHRGVKDPDQAWILGELIRYLENPRSGALPKIDMGSSWVQIRDAARHGTLRANDQGVGEVVQRWDELLRYGALVLGRELGAPVDLVASPQERENSSLRVEALVSTLISTGRLEGTLKIPDVAAPIELFADLRTRQVGATMQISAPREGRPRTKINWLLRQLKSSPANLVVDAFIARSRDSLSEPLFRVQENPELLVRPDRKDPIRFRLTLTAPMGNKRALGSGGFPSSVLDILAIFYESTAQKIKPWTASAPTMRREVTTPVVDEYEAVGAEHKKPTGELVPVSAARRDLLSSAGREQESQHDI